ncbi:MAG TPA: hypothetical protein VNJ31_03645 [Methyloceanibacter sp.]|nr:hypothetical protein [Methyloceanibacter sp.]
MQTWGLLLLVIGVFVANLPAVAQQWRTDRQGFIKTLWLIGVYALYVALGLALLLMLLPGRQGGEESALLLTGVVTGWIFYGALTLMRVVPRYREPPAWLMRFGIADILILGMLFGCLATYLWG